MCAARAPCQLRARTGRKPETLTSTKRTTKPAPTRIAAVEYRAGIDMVRRRSTDRWSSPTCAKLCSRFEQHLDRPLAAGHGRYGEAVRAGVALHRDDPAAAVRHQVGRVSGAVDAGASGLRVLLNAELHRLCSVAAVRTDGVVPAVAPVDVEISGHPGIESRRVARPGAAVVEQCLRLERCGRWAGRWRRAGRWRDHVKPGRGRGGARGYACYQDCPCPESLSH